LFLNQKNYFRLIGAEVRDSCGCSGTGETPQVFTRPLKKSNILIR
jgi:hypothetical protein